MTKYRQYQIAEYLGISAAFMSEVRSGKKSFSVANYIAVSDRTGLSLDVLLRSYNGETLYTLILQARAQLGN